MCLGVCLFGFIPFGVSLASWIYQCFSHHFFEYLLSLTLSFLSGTPVIQILCLLWLFYNPGDSVCYFQSSFSFFRLDTLYWFIFSFTDSFLCHPHSAIESMQWGLFFDGGEWVGQAAIVFFSSGFHWCYFTSFLAYSFYLNLYFKAHDYSFQHSTIAPLKSYFHVHLLIAFSHMS